MEEKYDPLGPQWPRVLDSLPCPLVLLDACGNTLYVNRSGVAVLDAAEGHEACGWVRRRQRWYEQAVRARTACCFEEDVYEPGGEVRHLCWVYAPVVDSGGEVTEVVVVGMEATEWCRCIVAEAQRTLVEQVARELQPPLASMTSLGGTLAGELTGTQAERAALIDQNGLLLLRRMAALLRQATPPPVGENPAG